tara:strand:- start:9 stop:635 length:627 start_codon:yes stop_codon:yes gene_type:complete
MVYNALREKEIRETIEEARKNIEEGEYPKAEKFIRKGITCLNSLPPPVNFPEKIEYLSLKAKSYGDLLGLYNKLIDINPLGIPDEEFIGLKKEVKELVERLGIESKVCARKIKNAGEMGDAITACKMSLDDYDKKRREEGRWDLADELREEVDELGKFIFGREYDSRVEKTPDKEDSEKEVFTEETMDLTKKLERCVERIKRIDDLVL